MSDFLKLFLVGSLIYLVISAVYWLGLWAIGWLCERLGLDPD